MFELLAWINYKKGEALRSNISDSKKNAIAFGVDMFDTGLCCLAGFGLGAVIGDIIVLIAKKKK